MGLFGDYEEEEFYPDLNSVQLDGCCGVLVVYSLEIYHESVVKKYHKEFVKELTSLTTRTPEGLAIVTINQRMHSAWDGILKEAGFTLSVSARNNNTRHTIYLYQKVIHPLRKTKPKKTRRR